MEDGIVGVFPTLLHQAGGGASLVLDETVSVGVAVLVDPMQSALDVWPDLFDKRQVARTQKIAAGQHYEKRGGIDAAVVGSERNFLHHRHFAAAHFMKDFSRFGVLVGYDFGGLRFGEVVQNAFRDT